MRRLLFFTAVLALLLAAPAQGAPVFVFSGKGWGHGVGLSQYGAYGFAQNGWTYDRILAHYYPGTTLGPAPVSEVRVLVAEGRGALRIGADEPFRVVDAAGQTFTLEAGTVRLGPGLEIDAEGAKRKLTAPVRFEPKGGSLRLDRSYRGAIVVHVSGRKLAAVNHLGLEQYLYGVIPGEMPAGWSPEALKSQAVAARSYALASLRGGGDFDLYGDTRSQVYGGISSEDARASAAVDATAGQVVLYGGAVARTFFFSTSGGRTAASGDVWGEAIPYLVPVDDPFDSISPHHRWGPVILKAREVATRLASRAPRALRDLTVTPDGSGRVGVATVVGAKASSEVPGSMMRSLLGLRSTWFDVGVLSLVPTPGRIVFGETTLIGGIARGIEGVRLEQRVPGGAWQPVVDVKAGQDGAFSLETKPQATTAYRLSSPVASGAVVGVRVEARVNFYRVTQGGKMLSGRVRPKVEGARVEIQRLENGGWKTIAETVTDARGEFRAELAVVPGTYRAVAAVGRGLAAGSTPPLEVVAG